MQKISCWVSAVFVLHAQGGNHQSLLLSTLRCMACTKWFSFWSTLAFWWNTRKLRMHCKQSFILEFLRRTLLSMSQRCTFVFQVPLFLGIFPLMLFLSWKWAGKEVSFKFQLERRGEFWFLKDVVGLTSFLFCNVFIESQSTCFCVLGALEVVSLWKLRK